MPTIKKRLNITLGADLERAIREIAKREDVPEATVASDLLRNAIQIEEDVVWDKIASSRDTKKSKFVKNSDKLWK